MTLPKRGERGFTLIELLIVVAILGVLAAVVIPNVGRFIGRGETEAGKTELTNIQSAVVAMMVDNQRSTLPNPVTVATSNMGAFPDSTSVAGSANKLKSPTGVAYTAQDKNGYLLYQHDITADSSAVLGLVNYTATQTTKGTYTVDASGTVTQVSTGY
jgi:prepilin-type N-terminal cleavage/methylation domain-containing protein